MSDKVNSTPTFESRVHDVIAATTKGEDGKLLFPEGTDELMTFAATAEIRRRDTQSSYTKSQQRLKVLETENNKLASSWEQDAVSNLSSSDKAKLDEMKVQDPDGWREEITRIEDAQRAKFQERRTTISKEANELTELEQRQVTLDEFNASSELKITSEVIENDVPPRITKELADGKITFEQFLHKAATYVTTPKAIKNTEEPIGDPAFATARGTNKPDRNAIDQQNSSDYANEIY